MPIRGQQAHRRSRGASRARMYLIDRMGWFRGFLYRKEGKTYWVQVPHEGGRPIETVELAESHLHEATYTWTMLQNRFPRTLPAVIPNLDAWRVGVPARLSLLKAWIHQGKPPPGSLFDGDRYLPESLCVQGRALRDKWPEGRPLIAAYSWIGHLHPQELAYTLEWIAAHRVALGRLLAASALEDGLLTAITLCEVARLNRFKDCDQLIQLAASTTLYENTFHKQMILEYLQQWQKRLKEPLAPKARKKNIEIGQVQHAAAFHSFLKRCHSYSDKERRITLTLFDSLFPSSLIERWDHFWYGTERVIKDILRAEGQAQRLGQAHPETIDHLSAQIEARRQALPAQPFFERFYQALDRYRSNEYRTLVSSIESLIPELPLEANGDLIRAPLLADLLLLQDYAGQRFSNPAERRLARYISGLKSYLRQTKSLPADVRFSPWEGSIQNFRANRNRYQHFNPINNLNGQHLKGSKEVHAVFNILAALMNGHGKPLDAKLLSDLTNLFIATESESETTIRMFQLIDQPLEEAGVYYNSQLLLAHRLAPLDDGHCFRALLKLFDEFSYRQLEHLISAVKSLNGAGWNRAVLPLILNGYAKRMIKIGAILSPAQKLGADSLPPNSLLPHNRPVNLERFPDHLHPALHSLRGLTSDKRYTDIVKNILGKSFPPREELLREIAYLREQIKIEPKPSLNKRLANLEKRLENPTLPSTKKLENLNLKLERAVSLEMLSTWENALSMAYQAALTADLDVEAVEPIFFQPEYIHIVAHTLELGQPYRALSQALFQQRNGPPPWHLHAAPANQAFIRKLREQGINLDPWLNPAPLPPRQLEDGRTLFLNIEEDPLEILRMGEHFNTCLSPGAFNFYSAVVNAADVNKRVIYARTEKGAVLGRCLIALTDVGGIITYDAYCHDNDLNLGKIIGEIIDQLAVEMGTIALPEGKPPVLMANDWYDDGTINYSERFAFLNDGSDFHDAIRFGKIGADQFIAECCARLNPLPLNELTIPPILSQYWIIKRADLIATLIPFIDLEKDTLPSETWSQVIKGLHYLGSVAEIQQIVKRHIIPYYVKHHHDGHVNEAVLKVIIEADPYSALNLMRKTRPKWVRKPSDEPSYRAKQLHKIYSALGHEKKKRNLNVDD